MQDITPWNWPTAGVDKLPGLDQHFREHCAQPTMTGLQNKLSRLRCKNQIQLHMGSQLEREEQLMLWTAESYTPSQLSWKQELPFFKANSACWL